MSYYLKKQKVGICIEVYYKKDYLVYFLKVKNVY